MALNSHMNYFPQQSTSNDKKYGEFFKTLVFL